MSGAAISVSLTVCLKCPTKDCKHRFARECWYLHVRSPYFLHPLRTPLSLLRTHCQSAITSAMTSCRSITLTGPLNYLTSVDHLDVSASRFHHSFRVATHHLDTRIKVSSYSFRVASNLVIHDSFQASTIT